LGQNIWDKIFGTSILKKYLGHPFLNSPKSDGNDNKIEQPSS
jgi:hypothetical protein